MRFVLFFIMFAFATFVNGQQDSTDHFKQVGDKFLYKETVYDYSQIGHGFKHISKFRTYYKRQRRLRYSASFFGGASIACAALGAYIGITEDSAQSICPGWCPFIVMMIPGSFLGTIGLVLHAGSKSVKRKSIYYLDNHLSSFKENVSQTPSLKIASTRNGMGLVYSF